MKKFLFMALAAVALFSCSKSNDVTQDGGDTKTVTLTIKNNSTKAAEAPGTAHETPIKDFTAYFLNSSGGVVETRKVTVKDETSYVLEGVSGLASKIYLVANTALTSTTLTGSNLTDLKANVLLINSYQAGIDKVILAASDAAEFTAEAEAEAGEYTATITIAPVVARLEIAQLEAISAENPDLSDITAFRIKAIYVNGYDTDMPLVGTASGRVAGTTANYETTDLKDENLSLTSTNNIIKPADSKVWAYQLFPGNAPTMVIQFSSVTFASGVTSTDAENLCITVTGFNPNEFAAANIYNVANIQFSAADLGKPYEATKKVSVTLTVSPWAIQATTVTLQ